MEVICRVFLAVHLQVMFEGAGRVPFKKTLSLQSYLNELTEDKILCMTIMSEVVVLTCKKNLSKKKLDKKILSQIILLF